MPGYKYGALLPPLSLNLIVADIDRSVAFYRDVLGATVHYCDVDFAAVRVGGAEIMLHADHTHEDHPWHPALASGAVRGIGLQIRLLGLNPDEVEQKAKATKREVVLGSDGGKNKLLSSTAIWT